MKMWTRDGHIVYSDEPRLIGARYPLGADELGALRGGGRRHRDLSAPENRFERSYDKLLEVYLPIRAPGGDVAAVRGLPPLQRGRRPTAGGCGWPSCPRCSAACCCCNSSTSRWRGSLARRLREGRREREALLEHALDASQTERRLIAADLHDGVVQDLLGVSYSLAADAARVNGSDPEAGAALREGATQTRETVSALRALLIDIYPPSLQSAGLAAALGDLATHLRLRAACETTVAVAARARAAGEHRAAAVPLRAGGAAQRVQARRRVARADPRERDRRRRPRPRSATTGAASTSRCSPTAPRRGTSA